VTAQKDAQIAFRNALGSFATGVTIATTKDEAGNPVGVTASSFNSVSLNPPLVLWSLAKNSLSRAAFCDSGHFAIHVLAATQEDLSNRFARSGADKFDDVEWKDGQLGSPIFSDHAALFECRTKHQYEGGDHIILLGEVVSYEARDEAPLLFHGGRYAETQPRPARRKEETVDTGHGPFKDDFLFHLLSRAYFKTSVPTRRKLDELGSSMEEYLTLSTLSMDAPLTADDIAARLAHTGHAPSTEHLHSMTSRALLNCTNDRFDIAEEGRRLFVETLAHSKGFEADLANHFDSDELAATKRVLRRVIDLSR
jgi:3-hydroxy-9,10-secoandrosta-1,3,5(10)-triene-9,17-dione monooxygenase reductase component